jgi:hypothetical protein
MLKIDSFNKEENIESSKSSLLYINVYEKIKLKEKLKLKIYNRNCKSRKEEN